jgi:hypothetical protein
MTKVMPSTNRMGCLLHRQPTNEGALIAPSPNVKTSPQMQRAYLQLKSIVRECQKRGIKWWCDLPQECRCHQRP